MTERLNIQKISSPVMGTSRVNQARRQTQDSPKKRFQEHFEDDQNEESEENRAGHAESSHRRKAKEKKNNGSDEKREPEPIYGNLGKRIDIVV